MCDSHIRVYIYLYVCICMYSYMCRIHTHTHMTGPQTEKRGIYITSIDFFVFSPPAPRMADKDALFRRFFKKKSVF